MPKQSKKHLSDRFTQRSSDLDKEAKRSREFQRAATERLKELTCLFKISELLQRPDITLDELYQNVVLFLPPAWQYPEITYAAIIMNGRRYETNNYSDTEWKLISDIEVSGTKTGMVIVGYLENRENFAEGPFMKEERLLIDAIAERLGKITERIQTHDALELTRFTIDSAEDMIVWTDNEANILDVNDTFHKKLGYSKEEIISMNLKGIDINFDEEKWRLDWNMFRQLRHFTFRTEHLTKRGGKVPVEVTRNYLSYNGKEYNCAFVHDITKRLKIEKELSDSRQRMSTFDQLVRRELAQELHGTVQSRLIVLMHRLTELKNTVSRDEALAQIENVQQTLSSVIDDHLRPISRRLYPSILRQGLTVALQSLADQFEPLIELELDIDESLISRERNDKSVIREQLGLALYRITEEALNNVVKHAEASKVTVNLDWADDKSLSLEITDNGKGFNLAKMHIGLGTSMMQDYSKLWGGDCTIQSTRGEGTKVNVSIPL